MSSTLVGLHLSPPLPPANWAACLPARSTGGGGPLEVVTQQLVPATTAPGSLLLSYRATPRFQRGHSKVAGNLPHRLPRAGLLAELPCSYQLLAWTHTSVGGKGRRTRAPPSQVETLPGAHKSGNLPSHHTRTQHLLGHVNIRHNGNYCYYQQACW